MAMLWMLQEYERSKANFAFTKVFRKPDTAVLPSEPRGPQTAVKDKSERKTVDPKAPAPAEESPANGDKGKDKPTAQMLSDPSEVEQPDPRPIKQPPATHKKPRKQPDDLPNPWGFSRQHLERFPALRKRNFFVIQRHHARAKHYDLRLQARGAHDHDGIPLCLKCGDAHRKGEAGTVSWAIPKGLHALRAYSEPAVQYERGEWTKSVILAVETTLHPIPYSTFESEIPGDHGHTMLYDVGEYTIGTSDWSRAHGRDHSPDTDDEDGSSSSDGSIQERAFLRSYGRGSVVVHLKGLRFDFRITLKVPTEAEQVKLGRSYGSKIVTDKKWWLVRMAARDGEYIRKNKLPGLKKNSILTGRSMEEIRSDVARAGKLLARLQRRFRQSSDQTTPDSAEDERDRAELARLEGVIALEGSLGEEGEMVAEVVAADIEARFLEQMEGEGKREATGVQARPAETNIIDLTEEPSKKKRRKR